ncbi:MAG: hypothetical protein ACE5F2_02720 [Candidatus Paceibacteria bacterium]
MKKLRMEVKKKIKWKFIPAEGGWSSRWVSENYEIANDNGHRRYDLFYGGLSGFVCTFKRIKDAKFAAELLII